MNIYMKWMGLMVAASALTACAAAPPSKPLTYGQTPGSVHHAVREDFSRQIFVLSDGGSSYRFESIEFQDENYINYWFVYRDGSLYAVIGHKEAPEKGLQPPCSSLDRAAWLELAQKDHAQDLKTYDFRDPEDYVKEDKPTAGQMTGIVLLSTAAVVLYVEYPVALVFPIAVMAPGQMKDGKARAYADHPEFGATQAAVRSKIGPPAGGEASFGDCRTDSYGSTVYGAPWAIFWYLDGRLFAVEHNYD